MAAERSRGFSKLAVLRAKIAKLAAARVAGATRAKASSASLASLAKPRRSSPLVLGRPIKLRPAAELRRTPQGQVSLPAKADTSPATEIIFDWGASTCQGLGDCLRGIFAAMQFSKRHGLRFSVCMAGNVLEPFLQYRTPADVRERAARARPRRVQFLHKCSAKQNGVPSDVDALPHERGTVLLFTNVFPAQLPTEEERAFVRSLLVVRPQWVVTPPAPAYSLLHIRTSDAVLAGGNRVGGLDKKQVDTIRRCTQGGSLQPWFLISDSAEVVALTKRAFPRIKTDADVPDARFSAPPGHVALTRDGGRLATTVRDMQRVCGAKEIVTVSNYRWTSGFVLWLAVAFGIKVGTYGPSTMVTERQLFGTSLALPKH
jgi:hypothetical protein